MTAPDRPSLDFESKEEFRATCLYLSARMGYLNRVAIGESRFVLELSKLLTGLGAAFDDYLKDPDIHAAFGDGWTKGTLTDEEQSAYLWKLITEGK